jgi:Na+-driven multidrug efflux pump
MQDSWGPLKSLAIASGVNLTGDILLCTVMGYGIAGAAWATMASQVCRDAAAALVAILGKTLGNFSTELLLMGFENAAFFFFSGVFPRVF